MNIRNRNIFALALLLIASLLVLLATTQGTNMLQHARIRAIVLNNVPLQLGGAQNALQHIHTYINDPRNSRDPTASQHLRSLYELVRDKFRGVKDTLLFKATDIHSNHKNVAKLVDQIDSSIVYIAEGVAKTKSHPQQMEKLLGANIESSITDLHELQNEVYEQDGKDAVAAMADIDANARLSVFLFIGIIFAGIGLFVIVWKQTYATRRALEQASQAEQRNALFATAIEATTAGVIISDPGLPDNPVVFVNQAFIDITGYSREEIIGRNCRILQGIHTDKEVAREISDKVKKNAPVSATILNYRKDGTQFWNDLKINSVYNKQGEVINHIALQSDITHARATQEALILAKDQAERATKVKSNFMAMISHEIRTPIGGILGTLSLLHDTTLTDSQTHLVVTAISSGQSLMTIVNDILDFSKMEAGKLELEATAFDLFEVIESTINLMRPNAEKKGIKLLQNVETNLPRHVIGDPTRIKQILLNFISNAIKFTQEGNVTVKVAVLLEHASEQGMKCVTRFEVIDTGIGISHDGQTKLFTEFSQLDASIARRYGGTGLGLAICKRLINLMGGEIGVESRPGSGSKFWFVLPIGIATATTSFSTAPQTETLVKHRGKILVVEDNQTNQMILSAFLRKDEHDVTIAENGALALAAVQSHPYDLVFMDISMPVMDGFMATQKIRALGKKYLTLPIIAMTAQTMPGDREKCFAAGMNGFISKPVDRKLLSQETQKWLSQIFNDDRPNVSSPDQKQPATEAAPAVSVYDSRALHEMASEIGKDVVLSLISVFSTDLQNRQHNLLEAITRHNWQTVTAESHALKSSSASCGLMEFSDLMKKIEFASKTGETAAVTILADRIDPCAQAAQAALKEARAAFSGE